MAADGSIKIDTKIDQTGIDKGIKDMKKNLESTATKLKGTGKKMSAGLTAPIVGLGTIAFAAADQVDQAYRNIRVGTGATGEDLEALKAQFEEVFTSVPDSAEQVSNSLSNINTLTGATGDVLGELTQNVLDASRSLGEDGVANSEAFGKAMGQWQIPAEEGVDELDKLYKMTQDYGVGLGEISSHLTEYGSVLQNAGFSMGESADLMGKLEAGGLSVSRVMPGLNMAFRNWASEGKNSREEFDKTIKKMQDAETETEALAIATEEFGAEGAQRLTTAIRNGAIPALDELGGASDNSKGAIRETTEETRTIGEEFGILKNTAMKSLQPLGEILLDLAKQAIPPLIEGVTKVAEWFTNLSPAAQKIIVVVGGILAVIGPLLIFAGMLVSSFAALIPIFVAVGKGLMLLLNPIPMLIIGIAALAIFIYGHWDQIKEYTVIIFTAIGEFFVMTWEWIKELFNSVLTWIIELYKERWATAKEIITTVFNAIKEFISNVWNGIKEFFNTVITAIVNFVKNRFNNLKNNVSTIFNAVKTIASSVWNGIKSTISNIVSGIWSTVKRIFNKIKSIITSVWDTVSSKTSDIWNGIVDTIKGAINGVISAINGMINAVNGISIKLPKVPDWVPGLGGKGGGTISFPNIPNIPSLDVGTNFVAQDGLAMLHKGEAVVPKEYNPAAGGDVGGVYEFNVEIPLDGEVVAQKTVKFTARELEAMKKTNARGKGIKR